MRRVSKKNENKTKSHKKLPKWLLAVTLFACLIAVSYAATDAVITSATYGDRELPIYCGDTTEKKVALSFDAAWGAS